MAENQAHSMAGVRNLCQWTLSTDLEQVRQTKLLKNIQEIETMCKTTLQGKPFQCLNLYIYIQNPKRKRNFWNH